MRDFHGPRGRENSPVVLDECTRKCVAIAVNRHLTGEDLVAVLDKLSAIRGALAHLRADNGPEMISWAVKAWCEASGTGALYIDPGSPWQNGIVEILNGRLRDELLSSEIFDTLAAARYLIDWWQLFYNHRRIQRALGKVTPAAFAATCTVLPPLRLALLACAAAPPCTQEATTMHQLSYGVDR